MTRLWMAAIVIAMLCPALRGDCTADHRSNKNAGVLVTDFSVTGTQALSATDLARVTGGFVGACFDDDSEEIGERLRAGFQELGYFAVEVKHVDFKPGDPLAIPKPVAVEADVSEGPQFRLADIAFEGNHAYPTGQLRETFPLKTGEVFSRGKVATGLDAIRKLYGTRGYLDFTAVPETVPASNATMLLKISVEEGPQYHMGKLEISASKEAAARLRMEWKLEEGAVYDHTYIDKYLEANRDLLPAGFTRDHVETYTDCPHAVVEVKFVIDPAEDKGSPPKSVACESKDDKENETPRGN